MKEFEFDVKVTGVTEFRIRFWIATQLIKLAALIARWNLEFEVMTNDG